jgi:hypothetical protein
MENNTSTLKKYILTQNNSYGSYDYPEWDGDPDLGGVCAYYDWQEEPVDVWIMAHDPAEACVLASKHAGVYFDGVSKGMDCDCCGDRWYEDPMEF